jgi:hypothetical protein
MFLAESGLAGLLKVSMFALFMGVCWPPVAATQFSTFMGLLNLSNWVGALAAGPLVANFSLAHSHFVLAGLQFVLIGVALAIDPLQVRRELGEGTTLEDEATVFDPRPVE